MGVRWWGCVEKVSSMGCEARPGGWGLANGFLARKKGCLSGCSMCAVLRAEAARGLLFGVVRAVFPRVVLI